MRGKENAAIASYCDWWSDAGLIDPVQDDVCAWLQPGRPANDVMPPPVAPAPERMAALVSEAPTAPFIAATPIAELPDDLASFDAWLRDHEAVPGAAWSARRILPTGPADAPIMVMADMPDADDLAAGWLLSGAVGELFDAMLHAIGTNRTDLRLASISVTRPAGGRWDDASAFALRNIALHHIRLAQPQRVLLLGQMTCRLLTGDDVPADGTGLRNINHYGVTTAATAIHHPRLLLTRPALKRGAWTALKMLREPA